MVFSIAIVLKMSKEIAAAAKAKGNAALAAKDYDAAISAYTEAIKVRPGCSG